MTSDMPLLASQVVVRVCLFLVAAIAITGGTLQMYLGQPDTAPRLDNVHRFMAGVYLSTGFISFWAAMTIRQQGTLVYLLALGVFLAGTGRSRLPYGSAIWFLSWSITEPPEVRSRPPSIQYGRSLPVGQSDWSPPRCPAGTSITIL